MKSAEVNDTIAYSIYEASLVHITYYGLYLVNASWFE